MTKEEITEGNKLIAEFMGLPLTKETIEFSGDRKPKIEPSMRFRYNDSWDWLMPVVEKIETMVIKTNITTNIFAMRVEQDDFNDIVIDFKHKGISKIEGVYLGCVRFIKWHNNNKH